MCKWLLIINETKSLFRIAVLRLFHLSPALDVPPVTDDEMQVPLNCVYKYTEFLTSEAVSAVES
jgi:hypothetical protein